MDLHEDAEKNLVTASFEFPGLSKDDVQISVHNGRLMVAAHTKSSTDMNDHEKGYAVRERRFGRFWRTLQLPLGVKVCANFHGYIRLPSSHRVDIGRPNQCIYERWCFEHHFPKSYPGTCTKQDFGQLKVNYFSAFCSCKNPLGPCIH